MSERGYLGFLNFSSQVSSIELRASCRRYGREVVLGKAGGLVRHVSLHFKSSVNGIEMRQVDAQLNPDSGSCLSLAGPGSLAWRLRLEIG